MKHFSPYFLVAQVVVALFLVTVPVSCGRENRVIPKGKMAEIYAEMYVLDQWLDDNRSLRREADTSLVYAPILDKYGYTYDDYLNSVEVYMKDPTRYSRILRKTSEILNNRLSKLKAEKKARDEAMKESRRLDSLRHLVHLNVDSLIKTMIRVNPSDSLAVEVDSLGFLNLRFVEPRDTLLERIDTLLEKRDTLSEKRDTLLKKRDTLLKPRDTAFEKRDTLLKKFDTQVPKLRKLDASL